LLDPSWFSGCSPDNGQEISAALSVDPARFANVYTCAPTNNVLGWTNVFPGDAPENSTAHALFVLWTSLPGGSAAPYNQGKTAVHEMGHFLGLYHTFQGGCGSDSDPLQGDAVLDTPPEASPAFGDAQHLAGRDTCKGLGQSLYSPWYGVDPTSSFMDYSGAPFIPQNLAD